MKYLIVLTMAVVLASCLYIAEEPDSPTYMVEEPIYAPCTHDPLPFDYPMEYCVSYSDADCCVWEDWGASWECSYEWCYYWDECRWEYMDSECWW